ncbi:MAG: ATP/GTP-binding protein [Cyclobacteriaceae bacterium]
MQKRYFLLIVIALGLHPLLSAQTLTLKWKTDSVLSVPESVYFDGKANLLYVSNIAGKANEKDGNGFISKISPEGKIITKEWAGGLDAPKGMGIFKNKLFVADLSRVAIIDLTTGKVLKRIDIDGARFLNDVTVDKRGVVYLSDSETGKIFTLTDETPALYFESVEFKRINGLLSLKNGIYVADAGNGMNYKLSADKQLSKFAETAPGADGIVLAGENEFIVSSWGGEIYFVDANGKSTKMLDTKAQKLNSADIDYDPKTKTVFVPTFFGNSVMGYQFKK